MGNNQQEILIEEQYTMYDVEMSYHSDKMCENYDAKFEGVEEKDGTMSLRPNAKFDWEEGFIFKHSDPDRVIALAEMMKAFAQMVKKNNQKSIDISKNE